MKIYGIFNNISISYKVQLKTVIIVGFDHNRVTEHVSEKAAVRNSQSIAASSLQILFTLAYQIKKNNSFKDDMAYKIMLYHHDVG